MGVRRHNPPPFSFFFRRAVHREMRSRASGKKGGGALPYLLQLKLPLSTHAGVYISDYKHEAAVLFCYLRRRSRVS